MRAIGLFLILSVAIPAVAQEAKPAAPNPPVQDGSHLPRFSDEPDSAHRCPEGQGLLEGECVKYPKLLKRKTPAYPPLAQRAKVQGTVVMLATLLPDGTVGDITVTKGPGKKLGFEESAIKAVKKWVYEPVVLHGKPIAIQFDVTVNFSLTD
jgi:TonB family protein